MRIAGLQKNSMVDFPGKISAVIFTQGCNMNCGYCHNRRLIKFTEENEVYDEDSVLAFLDKRRGLLDGVVISGGEPTLQKDLPCFIEQVKKMGFKTKLDTNGTDPGCLKTLIDSSLLDYVAMDIKAPLCKYGMVCCSPVNTEKLMESIEILKNAFIEYEFRTTYTPELNDDDLMDISRIIKGAKKYVLQQYKEVDVNEGNYTGYVEKRNILRKITAELMESVGVLQFRGDFVLI
ncbi:MAG: anaerobic ribonucleoside-triphosphate reductase activating protein [Clostridiaceae bacterium]|jgi:pyruvate formate lyase activating enzyme|nr:anaerobic ribonucleoside-triphosphate reductase activating protein [Clostridiaceae bacterium]